MDVAKQIGEIKKHSQLQCCKTSRYNEVLERAIIKGEKVGLSNEFIKTC